MKQKNKLIRWLALLSILLCIGTLAGCGKEDNGIGKIIYYYLNREPANLDPQVAYDSASAMLVYNLFDGLVRLDAEKNIQPGAAEKWTVSQDGLCYRFTLFSDAKWSDGRALTADDFLFGIQRSISPETGCKNYELLYCIQNAEAIYTGELPLSELGVRVLSDTELEITLEKSTEDFLLRLTELPFMPCNRDYFEKCGGKYGLESDKIISNGAFRIREKNGWKHGESIRLEKNEQWLHADEVFPSGVVLKISAFPKDVIAALLQDDAKLDAAPLPAEQLEKAKKNGLQISEWSDTVWGICINTAAKPFQSASLRKAVFASVNVDGKGIQTKLNGIIPEVVEIMKKSYREVTPKAIYPQTSWEEIHELVQNGLEESELSELPLITILCSDDMDTRKQVNDMVIQWKKGLGVYFRIQPMGKTELEERITQGNYQLAIYKVKAESDNPIVFLEQFTSENKNIFSLQSEEYDALVAAMKEKNDDLADSVYAAEQYLLSEGIFYPLTSESQFFAQAPGVEGIIYDPFEKSAIFQYVKKRK